MNSGGLREQVVLVLLDVSVAFNTIDDGILLDRLMGFEVTGTIL